REGRQAEREAREAAASRARGGMARTGPELRAGIEGAAILPAAHTGKFGAGSRKDAGAVRSNFHRIHEDDGWGNGESEGDRRAIQRFRQDASAAHAGGERERGAARGGKIV